MNIRFDTKGFFVFLALILSFLMFLYPFVISGGDAWDGAIISYAAEIQNFDGIKNWFFESGWPLQYYQIIIFNEISIFFDVKYSVINLVVVFLLMILCSFEVYFFSRDRLRHSRYISYMSVVIFLVFPIWFVISSNVMAYHFLCFTCALAGLRFFRYSSALLSIAGVLLISFSYTLSSLVMFIPALSLLCDSLDKNNQKDNAYGGFLSYFPVTYKTVVVSTLSFLVYSCNKIYYPSNGLYDGYNEIVSITSLHGLYIYAYNFIKFSSFLVVFFPFACLYVFLLKNKSIPSPLLFVLKNSALIILLVFSVFPYVAVGKGTTILDGTFNIRQGMLLGFPISILTTKFYVYFSQELSKYRASLWGWLPSILVAFIVLTFAGLSVKKILDFKDRVDIKNGVVEALKEGNVTIRPGIVNILANRLPKEYFRTYELNYMMYLAFGKAAWYARMGGGYDSNFNVPSYIYKKEDYQTKYIYTPSGMIVNNTVIDIDFSAVNKNDEIPKIKSVKIIN